MNTQETFNLKGRPYAVEYMEGCINYVLLTSRLLKKSALLDKDLFKIKFFKVFSNWNVMLLQSASPKIMSCIANGGLSHQEKKENTTKLLL